MREMWRRIFTTTALTLILCQTGLVMSDTAFAQQCVDNGNGTMTDKLSGLMWQRYPDGPTYYDHAVRHVSGLLLGGYSDWRLPRHWEFSELYHSECKKFVSLYEPYWAHPTDSYTAFDFISGRKMAVNKRMDFYVLGVRATQ